MITIIKRVLSIFDHTTNYEDDNTTIHVIIIIITKIITITIITITIIITIITTIMIKWSRTILH